MATGDSSLKPMDRPIIRVKYEGPGVEDGSIDAGALVSSLSAIQGLTELIHRDMKGSSGEVNVRVISTFRGSFGYEAALNVLGYVGDAISIAIGVGQLVLLATRRRDQRVPDEGEGDRFERLIKDPAVQQHVTNIIAPQQGHGIVRLLLEVGDDRLVAERKMLPDLTRDVPLDSAPRATVSTEKVTLRIISVAFKRSNKWRLEWRDGQEINAQIKDPDFWDAIEGRKRDFRYNDRLECVLEVTRRPNARRQSPRYVVTKVYRIIDPEGRQFPIPRMQR